MGTAASDATKRSAACRWVSVGWPDRSFKELPHAVCGFSDVPPVEPSDEGPRPVREEGMVHREERLLRDGRFTALGNMQVGIREIELPQHIRKELPIDQAVKGAPHVLRLAGRFLAWCGK